MSKIIFFEKKIINMYFNKKNYLKSNHNHIVKQALYLTSLALQGRKTYRKSKFQYNMM